MVIFLHGLGGSGADAFSDIGLADIGRRYRVFVVAPDGTADSEGRRFWNASTACCNLERMAVDDLARLSALIDAWRARPNVDPARVYIIGFSNGGFMAHRLACHFADRLTGIASISGAGPGPDEPCAVSSPLAVVEVHGDRDPVVGYRGGRVLGSPDLRPHPSAPETIREWARRLGCRGAGASGDDLHRVDLDPHWRGRETRIEKYASCRLGAAELWTVHGGDHGVGTSDIVESVWRELLRFKKPG